jgi:hypothetical protein
MEFYWALVLYEDTSEHIWAAPTVTHSDSGVIFVPEPIK